LGTSALGYFLLRSSAQRRFEPSSSPSATSANTSLSPGDLLGKSRRHFKFGALDCRPARAAAEVLRRTVCLSEEREPRCVDRFDSLLRLRNSLFVRIVSLLICLGNCPSSACSTEVSYSEIDPHRPKTGKFPVKFPVSREFARRRVRSALRRQGGSRVRTSVFQFTTGL
jgi:hypothetical protein